MPYLSYENKYHLQDNLRRRVIYQNYFKKNPDNKIVWTYQLKYLYENNVCAISRNNILDDAKYIICDKCESIIDYKEVVNYNKEENTIKLLCPICIGYLKYEYYYNTLSVVI